jgi:hypothetical protein
VIHEIHARKEYAAVPGIEITLEYKKEWIFILIINLLIGGNIHS